MDSVSNTESIKTEIYTIISGTFVSLNPLADSWVQDENGGGRDDNFGSSNLLSVGGRWTTTKFRSVIRFDLSSIPSNATITQAELKLYHSANNVQGSNTNTINLYRVLKNWQEPYVTWNNYTTSSPWAAPGADSIGNDRDDTILVSRSFTSASPTGQYYVFTLPTNLIQNYVNQTWPDYGFILIGQETGPLADKYFKVFSSKEAGSNPPVLELAYTSEVSPTVVIDGSIEHQTIVGLGGQMESHYAYENDTQFWDILFKDVGVSAVRLGGSNLTLENINDPLHQEELWPVYRIAKSYGLTAFGGGAHAKPEWKSPQVINGGTLLPQYYTTYSSYVVDVINAIENLTGVTVTMNSPFPEPSLGANGDPSSPYLHTYMSATDYRDFLKVYGPIMQSSKPNIKIYAPLDWNVSDSINYANTILSDSDARQWVDGLASNGYGWLSGLTSPANWKIFADLAKEYNVSEIWVPEQAHCTLCGNPAPDPAGLITARWLHEAIAIGNANIWQQWLLIDKGQYSSSGMVGFVYSKYWPCVNGVCEYSSNGITKDGYAFKQFAHWVRPGAIRIEATFSDSDILVSSYKHPISNTFTIVAINKGSSDKTVTFKINNYSSLSSLNVYRTSLNENSTSLGQVPLVGNSFSYTLPKESTTTFSNLVEPQPPDTTLPSTPTGLSSTAVSSAQINLTWTASTDNVGVTGYKIFRDGIQVGLTATPAYSDTGLTASTTYTYTVSAFDAAGNESQPSTPSSATTWPSLRLHGWPSHRAIYLSWSISVSLPATSTWRIAYAGPTGDQHSPITGILSPTRAFTLTGLTNYAWYTVTLNAMLDSTPFLTDTIKAMPTDILVYLPLVLSKTEGLVLKAR